MTMFNYESEELYQMARGETISSTPVYMADCKKEILTEVTPNYPKLTDYEKEWMYFAKNIYHGGGAPVPLEYLEVQTDNQATVENVIPYAYKSAILKGNTGYRDIDTGEILETFEEGRNLELVSVKMPVLTTTGKNLFDGIVGEDKKRIISTGAVINDSTFAISEYISVSPNKNYICNKSGGYGSFYDSDKKLISTFWISAGALAPQNAHYVRISFEKTNMDDLQFEENSTSTSYEPFKSNILTVNEDVTLRSNGGVYDELNLLTGRLTQRIDENNEVLAQEVVKTVDLSGLIKPYEGTNHYTVSSDTIPPQLLLVVPIESTGNQTLNDINTEE